MQQILTDFEEFLKQNIPTKKSFHPHFEEAMQKMFQAGGKRFRPLLLLSVVEAFTPLLLKNSFFPALAVEMIHTYSLIHDDLPTFDDSPLRRGEETLHITYDEVTATLVGDALNTEAFGIIAKAPLDSQTKVELVAELVNGAGVKGMVLGQAIDCFFENKKLSLEELSFLHYHKTATLIASSLKMGAIVANLHHDKKKLLEEIGYKMGVLFQIHDDIIDATQSTDEAGKPTGHDKDKNTFTNLLGLDGAKDEKRKIKDDLDKLFIMIENKKLSQRLKNMIIKYL